jgi:hypothetical protein
MPLLRRSGTLKQLAYSGKWYAYSRERITKYLTCEAYLKIKICTSNSPLCTVIQFLVHWSLFEDQNLYIK